MFGNGWLLHWVGKGEWRSYMILNLLGGRGIGEGELVRVIGHLFNELFKRNIFLFGRIEADA